MEEYIAELELLLIKHLGKAEKTGHWVDYVKLLDIDNVFSDDNLKTSNRLSKDVFVNSEKCSKEFVEFSGSIIGSSRELLRGCQVEPPCAFAVVALGSVARGEATPYSDLEYAFLIENDKEKNYFTQLAVDTYFRITNLNESPLKTFNIKVENSPDCLSEICPVGYRIDGLTPNAGNIPTGNRLGRSLTFTVEQAVKLYKEEVMSPSEKLASLSDLLITSQLIYCSDDGAKLHGRFMKEIATYEKVTAQNDHKVKRKRLERLSLDLQKYDFLPEFEFKTVIGEDVKVKVDIFRYITLLATNLNIALCFQLNFPWKVYESLYQSGIISKDSLRYLHIILGLSIYMRTMAYIMMGTQNAEILLGTPTAEVKSSSEENKHYYVPRKMFVPFGSILIPIKQSLISSNTKENKLIESAIMDWLADVYLDESQFSKAQKYYTESLEIRKVVHGEHTNHSDIALSYDNFGNVHRQLGNYDTALEYYTKSEEMLKDVYGEHTNHPHISSSYNNIGTTYRHLGNYDKALEYYSKALKMSKVVDDEHKNRSEIAISHNNLGEVHEHLGNYDKALKSFTEALQIEKDIYGEDADHPNIAISHAHIGNVHCQRGNLDEALKEYTKSLKMMKAVDVEHADNSNIAMICNKIGNVHRQQGSYYKALEYHTKSLKMAKDIHEQTDHPDIAISHAYIGEVHTQLGNYDTALEHYTKSREMLEVVYGQSSASLCLHLTYSPDIRISTIITI
ncbi:hypothetical protein EB796_007152 [Bugula neritina]|uniref:Protein-PII uridylyltransferase N-terminal domain-containing protein n=1 Tax=Bugula neritina TaxID=10212 RepID=A0A7J7K9C2_BUGNE|nr:hypothetical protein EB796_007152 [Bugula neritina]